MTERKLIALIKNGANIVVDWLDADCASLFFGECKAISAAPS
jgi:hypothetical protein